MKKIISSIAIAISINIIAQTPNILWQKTIGGTEQEGMNWNNLNHGQIEGMDLIEQTSDGGYILGGYSASKDGDVSSSNDTISFDYWIVKLNSLGLIQWEKSFGGSTHDMCTSIQETLDGGYIIAGTSNSNDGDITSPLGLKDGWIVKLNNIGSIQWEKSYGGSGYDNAYSIKQTADSGYIIAGFTTNNYWITKLNSIGNIQWEKTFGGNRDDHAYSIQQTSDGGYIIAGASESIDGDITSHHYSIGFNFDCWIVKLDNIGTLQWQKSLGGARNDYAYSIQQTNDGGYIFVGSTTSFDGDVTGYHGTGSGNP